MAEHEHKHESIFIAEHGHEYGIEVVFGRATGIRNFEFEACSTNL
jgi:hypothetical protein